MRNKVAVISGAFGALGGIVSREMARQGMTIAALDVASSAPSGFSDELGRQAQILGDVDLSLPEEAVRILSEIERKSGGIDVVVNIAGGFRWELIQNGDPATWDLLYATNLKTALNLSRTAIPYLLKSGNGRIVNIGANAAMKAGPGMGAYAAAKAAVHRLTESLAEELKNRGVTVNAVLPSIIDTPANRADMPDAPFDRWVTPQDLAAVILFLASDAARAVTGALIPVTGGL